MTAAQFYEAFLTGWRSAMSQNGPRLLAGRTLRWKTTGRSGTLTFAIATNSKTAGLVPHLPGEWLMRITWGHTEGQVKKSDDVSWFQYTTDRETEAFAELQRIALNRFLLQPNKEALRSIYNYTNDLAWLPRPNFDECMYYLDAEDARRWGEWLASQIESWIDRFDRAPESRDQWCWRVLWATDHAPAKNEA